ncbi:MACPF domain-containing protein At4g24290 isoform X3 [Syzygium oleosum]|uniref:MACPF domain-containing protein At4g24290 isoform X3 n=1 Tax=Syzygium oleosum TaxID=219896 RepID=UPI0024BADD95|nr:MACPF domain-containing protein At4g24290 isoform X3 [Syzygium oleosum]
MAPKLPAVVAAKIAIGSIGRGYDVAEDLRLKYCKGNPTDSRLIQIDEDDGREIVLPGGLSIPNVSKSIKCDKGERTRFRSDVLSFQQMSEQFNQDMSLTGKIPSGLFNAMFEFSGSWQKDAVNTKTLAFDGVFITLYTVALEKSQIVLCDHVKNAVPTTWESAALARFIEMFGTHIIVGIKMGGKDVIFVKQQHSSTLQPADVQKRLKEMADKRFIDVNGQYMASEQVYQHDKFDIRGQRLQFADASSSSSYLLKEDIATICKRRGGSASKHLSHNDWLNTVQLEPDVISMSFIPITSLLSGVPGSGFLSHAINLYLRYKPPIGELHQFLEFQLPRQWAPVFSELPLGPQRKRQSTSSLRFSLMGPKLYVNTTPVENYGMKNVLFLRLRFATALGAAVVKRPEWDGSPGLAAKSGLISTLISHHFSTVQRPPPRPAEVNINSAVYPGGPPVPVQAPKLLKLVDTTEMTRGPEESPGYWVVSGARLMVEKGRISLRVKYSLLTVVLLEEETLEDH